MRHLRKLVVLMTILATLLIGTTVFANNDTTTGSNIRVETEEKDGKEIIYLISDDDAIRITQPNKISSATFESKINIMGEAATGTDITIKIYNKKDSTKTDKSEVAYKEEPTKAYTLTTVGITKSFNQLLELTEGENKIVLTYTTVNPAVSKEKVQKSMVFYITRAPEADKERLKNYIVFIDGNISE